MAYKPASITRPVVAPLMAYVYGEAMPLPEVVERNTDSVWALFTGEMSGNSDQRDTLPMQLS